MLYVNQSMLFAVPFDLERLAPRGAAFPVLDDVAYAPNFGCAQLDIAAGGVLVYRRDGGRRLLAWVDRAGEAAPLAVPPGRYGGPRLSPDGSRAVIPVIEGGVSRLLLHELETARTSRLADSFGTPVWTPDGAAIVAAGPHGLARLSPGGTDAPLPLGVGGVAVPASVSRDGMLAYHALDAATHFDLWTARLRAAEAAAADSAALLATAAIETWPVISPDGRWVAHASNETGVFEVYVRAFPDGGPAVRVSRGGGRVPVWSRARRELLYQTDDERVMALDYEIAEGRFVASEPREWTPVRLADTGVLPALDLAPDGDAILAVLPSQRPNDRASPGHATFVFDFADRVRRLSRLTPE